MTPIETLLSKLQSVKKSGTSWKAICPAHDDRNPSLSVSAGDDGRVLVNCFAGCKVDEVVASVGLRMADLMAPSGDSPAPNPKPKGKPFSTASAAVKALERQFGRRTSLWTYHDAGGRPVCVVGRWDIDGEKEYRPVTRFPDGWHIKAMPSPRPLYRLPELATAERVVVNEGEKAADGATGLGFVATTSVGGAMVPHLADWTPLAGKVVWVIEDNDDSGRKYAITVAEILTKLSPPAIVKILPLPGLPEHGDVVDWIEAHGDAAEPDDLRHQLVAFAETVSPYPGERKSGGGSAGDWPDPVPFTSAFDPPPFPVGVLPEWMRDYVVALAEEKQVPVDLPAMLVLGASAAGIARKVTVSPWPGWNREPTNLFAMVCLPPGERKSQTFGAVFGPVNTQEAELREREEPAIREAESLQRVAQKRVDHLEGKIAKSDDAGERARLADELKMAREEFQAIIVPAMPLLRVDDDTPEMLALELVKQQGRLLAASPEARTLENITRYSDAPNFDVFLKGHAGDEVRTGRVGRGRDAVDRPALTCVYSPQPCVLEGLGDTRELRGRGFLARWFYSLPPSAVGYRKVRGDAVPTAVQRDYENALLRLWRTDYANLANEESHDLTLAADACTVFEEFERWKEIRLRHGGELAGFGGWANKLGGLCVRLACIFHVADAIRSGTDWTRTSISVGVVRRAATLCRDYAIPHARAAFDLMGATDSVVGARAVLKWVRGRPDRLAAFSKRDAFNGCRGSFDTVDDLQPCLELLERHYLIRPKPVAVPRPGPGQKPSPVYEVNPRAFAGPAGAQNPHNAQNSSPACARVNSA